MYAEPLQIRQKRRIARDEGLLGNPQLQTLRGHRAVGPHKAVDLELVTQVDDRLTAVKLDLALDLVVAHDNTRVGIQVHASAILER